MIYGNKIILKPFSAKNLELTREWANDLELNAGILRALPVSEYDQERWYENMCKDASRIVFAVYDVNDSSHIGNCGFYHIDYLHRRAEFWTLIGNKTYWGKGYGTEIVQLLLCFGFESLNLNRIFLHVSVDHYPAARLYEQSGFNCEGILREQYYIQGKYVDVQVMGVLKKDYYAEK